MTRLELPAQCGNEANGASIRNFGFVTVTGQERGWVWDLASRSAAIWREIAGPAGIPIDQQGLLLVAQRPEAVEVIDAFLATEMGVECTRLDAARIAAEWPMVRGARAGLLSRRDLRVDSPRAIPALSRWPPSRPAAEKASAALRRSRSSSTRP